MIIQGDYLELEGDLGDEISGEIVDSLYYDTRCCLVIRLVNYKSTPSNEYNPLLATYSFPQGRDTLFFLYRHRGPFQENYEVVHSGNGYENILDLYFKMCAD